MLFPDKASFSFLHDFPLYILFQISFVSLSLVFLDMTGVSYKWKIVFETKDHELK